MSKPSPPSIIHHAENPVKGLIPTTALLSSVPSGAHVSSKTGSHHRHSIAHDTTLSASQVQDDHQRVLHDLNKLYSCTPSVDLFASWNKDAVFEDPLSKCQGYKEYTAQWFALPKLVSKSVQLNQRVMASTLVPNRLVYTQTQEYTLKLGNRKKVITSIIVVDFDENDKITSLVDQWDGNPVPTSFPARALRALNGKMFPWFISVPKA